jgi:HK97 family phage portal protein
MSLDLFTPSNDREREFLTRATPRGKRQSLPSAIPGSNVYPGPSQWGAIDLPNPSEQVIKGLPAANRALSLISNGVASMTPLEMWDPDGYIDPGTPTLLTRPNAVYTPFAFWQMSVATLLMHGNFLGLWADFDSNGYPQQCVPVPAGFWIAYFDEDGFLTYAINGETYDRSEVCHVALDATAIQPMGVGVVTKFRRSLGQALDQQNYAADTYRSGAVPAGVIELDLPEVDVTQSTFVTGQWLGNHAGGRAPAVLPNNMKFVPLSWSPEDLQFLDARTHTIGEIALMFNMDATDLGASFGGGSALTYANIEQREQSRIGDTYAPIARRFEEEFSDQIPSSYKAKFCPANLLRTDTKTRAEVEQLRIANETQTVDEARKTYGLKPLPKPKPAIAAPGLAGPSGAPGAAPPAGNGALTGDLLPVQPDGSAPKPMVVPDDPNISTTPTKIKV